MQFKKPKSGHFAHYCYECAFWKFQKNAGAAHIGICYAIKDEPDKTDAYDPPCGLFTTKRGAFGTK